MFDSKSIDDIATRLANAIPPSFNHFKEDAEKKFSCHFTKRFGAA